MLAARRITSLAGGVLALLLLSSHPASGAGEEKNVGTVTLPSARRWMLHFRIERDFAFSGFQDAGLSVQRDLSERSALRLGVGIAATSGTSSRLDQDFNSLQSHSRGTAAHGHSYGVDFQWIRYRPEGEKTRVYWGLGPSAGYGRSSTTESATYSSGPSLLFSRSVATWIAGAGAVVGAEWWPVREVGFIFEYGMTVSYREVEDKFRSETPPSRVDNESRALSKSWETEVASVRLGVGIRM